MPDHVIRDGLRIGTAPFRKWKWRAVSIERRDRSSVEGETPGIHFDTTRSATSRRVSAPICSHTRTSANA